MNAKTTTHQPATTNRPLPEGWRWVKLGEVCELESGRFISRQEMLPVGHIPIYGANGIIGYTSQSCFNERRIVIGRVGSCGAVQLTRGNAWITDNTIVCKPTNSINIEFLFLFLKTIDFSLLRSSSIQPLITQKTVRNIPLPHPPLPEQQRIAAVLREQMDAVERARRAAEEQLEAAKALPAAYLRQVFPRPGEPLPEGWRWVRLGEVCEFLDSQRIPINEVERNRRIEGKSISNLYPYYGANGQVGWIDDYIFDEPLILLAEDGGSFGSWNKPIAYTISGKCWVNNHAHVLRPRRNWIYFDYCLYAILIRPDVGQMVSGSTRAKLNQEIASAIPIPLPPLPEQKRIAAVLREQMDAGERLRRALEEQLEAIKKLPAAMLRKAFNGEL